MKITVAAKVQAPLAQVWHAYNSPEDIVAWNTASDDWHTTRAKVDLRVGGKFSSRMEARDGSAGFDLEGTYTLIEPGRLLAYNMGERAGLVVFSDGPAGVHISVNFDAEQCHPLHKQRDVHQAILNNFKRYVENR